MNEEINAYEIALRKLEEAEKQLQEKDKEIEKLKIVRDMNFELSRKYFEQTEEQSSTIERLKEKIKQLEASAKNMYPGH